eukprot:jgi/Botrbrau1/330/Bobra.0022s0287.1
MGHTLLTTRQLAIMWGPSSLKKMRDVCSIEELQRMIPRQNHDMPGWGSPKFPVGVTLASCYLPWQLQWVPAMMFLKQGETHYTCQNGGGFIMSACSSKHKWKPGATRERCNESLLLGFFWKGHFRSPIYVKPVH